MSFEEKLSRLQAEAEKNLPADPVARVAIEVGLEFLRDIHTIAEFLKQAAKAKGEGNG